MAIRRNIIQVIPPALIISDIRPAIIEPTLPPISNIIDMYADSDAGIRSM